jgi:protein TonB
MRPPAATNARVYITLALSVALHGATLAAWRPLTIVPPRLHAFEPIEVTLIGSFAPTPVALPHPAVTPLPDPAPRPQPVAMTREEPAGAPTTPQAEDDNSGAEEPSVEARADVASLHNPKPPYPLAARRRGIEGQVLIAAYVRADGACAEVRLKRSSGHTLLDASALDAVRRWRFLPAKRAGAPIDSWVEVPVRFQLEG